MRLLKLLVIAIVIGSIYFYAKQHVAESNHWHDLSINASITIQFPQPPASKSFQKDIASLGKVKLTTYQSVKDSNIFVLLLAEPVKNNIRDRKLNSLEDAMHVINDTRGLTITHQQAFMFRSHPGIEYKATNHKGAVLWCRTIKKDNQLISIIYGSSSTKLDGLLRDIFFSSLQL